ncbi:MAG: phospholipase [Proteobacteria bacterium]|nr:MAG: phospholipase [Pseudomonadota bacterium]
MTGATGFLDREIAVGGARRRWVLHVPLGYDAQAAWPAIVFLHGRGESGRDGRRQLAQGLAPAMLDRPEAWPFVVAFPQKADETRPWTDELPLLAALLAELDRTLRLDPARRHLTGLSQGGHGTIALATQLAWRFASLVPVCGGARDPGAAAAAIGATPLWAFHGDDDPIVPLARSLELVDAIAQRGGSARLTRYAGVGHDSWAPAYREPELPRWMLAQRT